MKRVNIIAVVFAIFVSTLTLSLALEESTFAIKDTSLKVVNDECSLCQNSDCMLCQYGKELNLVFWFDEVDYSKALVGFVLPDGALSPYSEITACFVQFPPFINTRDYGANISVFLAKSSDWEEETVSPMTAPKQEKFPLAVVELPEYTNLGPVDVTPACKKAKNSTDGQFSIFLHTDNGRCEMGSKESGNPAILRVIYQ